MLLTSVILVLRETIEASLIVSVLLAFSVYYGICRLWIFAALVTGIVCAWVYASNVAIVSEWFDYLGLEIVNAAIQFAVCLTVLLFAWLNLIHQSRPLAPLLWQAVMAIVVVLAIAREGFEILLYISGVADGNLFSSPVMGGLLGGGIGISAGALLYYALVGLPGHAGLTVLMVLLTLFAGNMAAQGGLLLIQADWLPAGQALWDTSGLIDEGSLLGQLLYALIGYEATPTAIQAGAYAVGAGLVSLVFFVGQRKSGVFKRD